MKKLNLINIICAWLFCFASVCSYAVQSWYPQQVVKADGSPQQALTQLMQVFNLKPNNNSLSSVVEVTQKAWLRKAGSERWQITTSFSDTTIEQSSPLLIQLGLVEKIVPQTIDRHFDYGLLLGSRLKSTIKRIAFAVSLWDQGLRFKKLVALVGQRDLDGQDESVAILLTSPLLKIDDAEQLKKEWQSVKTEADMTKIILQHVVLPHEMREKVCIEIIAAPKKIVAGNVVRPTTADTVAQWLLTKPFPGTCIAFSSQPHVLYQQAVLATLLPPEFAVESAGEKLMDLRRSFGEILDALARLLFQEQQRLA